ncbi:hypothetical protein SAMN04488063_3049 [Halopelagius inordinatus]|uniref:Uncharacterized protein n=1 Tax=Halopelagius inordinatus TaxID=553467 RepID=A0A1I2V9E4_9EURY|nr:hypothetical protein [Halopelagius inordinatus]SFG83781.1 hypothetical protein SAMN04488063_3049 [Halopelagius inordinatus]
MSFTVHLDENESVRLTDEIFDVRPPDRVAFAVRGTITMTEELLGSFAGATLNPARVDISTGESDAVGIDLAERSSLRLETVDVGVETPDTDDLSPGMDALGSSSENDADDTRPGAIAFTVEGAISDVPEATLESLSEGSPTLAALTFAVETPVRSDGGASDDPVFRFSLFGYGIVVHRDGVVEIGTGGGLLDVDIP